MKKVLTIAGSDSCAGAGIQADLKTFYAHKVYGLTAITSITAQNTVEIKEAEGISSSLFEKQLQAIAEDIQIDGVKIGMLYNREIVKSTIKFLKNNPHLNNIVVDPVMISSTGKKLLKEDAIQLMQEELFPLADLVTPNISEASFLSDIKINNKKDVKKAAKILVEKGIKRVLIKGGHLEEQFMATDVYYDNEVYILYKMPRISSKNTHGTGCTFSSAIAAQLAKGNSMSCSIQKAKEYVSRAIEESFSIGKGSGPLNH